MASRASSYWRSLVGRLGGNRRFATTAMPTMSIGHDPSKKSRVIRGDFVPVYVALGMILLSLSFGVHTAKQQLLHSPNVYVSKKKRETIPEVVDPDYIVKEANEFMNKSLFRRIAHVQDFDRHLQDVMAEPSKNVKGEKRVETLKSVGVDPSKV